MIQSVLLRVGCAVLCAAAMVAQETQRNEAAAKRRALLGRVSDDQGNPCAGAEVTLHGVQPFWIERSSDTVVVTTDERGRFVAKVLPQVAYCGFAVTAASSTGAVAASRLVGWFGAGAQVAFVCGASVAAATVRTAGSAAWSACGPLAWSLSPADTERGCGSALPFAPDGDGRAALHPFFAARAAGSGPRTALCEVRTSQGELLWSRLCAPSPDLEITLPQPRPIPFVVRDAAQQPIAGARIAVRQGFRGDGGVDGLETVRGQIWRELGSTDGDGRLTATVPLDLDPFTGVVGEAVVFRARSVGSAESMSGFLGNQDLRDDQRVLRGEAREVSFVLRSAPDRTLRVLRGGKPAAGAQVRIDLIAKTGVNGAGFTHDPRSFEAVAAADGTATFSFLPLDVHGLRVQVLEAGAIVPIVCAPDSVKFGQTIELADSTRLRLRVLDARDGPCPGACGYVRWAEESTSGLGADLRFVTDSVGSADLALLPAGRWELALGSQEFGLACELLELSEPQTEREIHLQPFAIGRGTLLDQDGQPVASAAIRKWEFAGDILPDSRLQTAFLKQMQTRLCLPVLTAADGTFALPMVPVHKPSLRLSFVKGGRASEVTELAPDLGPTTLRMR